MKRLKKVSKPRAKKKETVLTVKFTFEAFNDNEDEAKLDCKNFKEWMNGHFPSWNESILQYFLYAYSLTQNDDNSKYKLEAHIDKIIKDESVP